MRKISLKILQLLNNGYAPLNILIPNFMALSMLMDGIVRNFLYFFCRQLTEFAFFSSIFFFVDETWLTIKKKKAFAALISK